MLAIADRVIDSSDLNVHQLRRLIITEMGLAAGGMTLLFESFAYRRGVPSDADFVFDARCLPNPHWEPRLRPLSGKDVPVREWLDAQADVVAEFTTIWRAASTPGCRASRQTTAATSRSAIGCTGGRHRSVYLVEKLAEHFRATAAATF